MIQGNLTAVFHLLKLVVPVMRKQNFGVLLITDFKADSAPGWIYRSAFAAAKVGLVSLTKTVAYEEAEYGITANMVCPGDIIGDMKEATIQEARQLKSITHRLVDLEQVKILQEPFRFYVRTIPI